MISATDCCGCGACAAVCPARCITMSCDAEGFPVPATDAAVCTGCGLCKKVCPSLEDPGGMDNGFPSLYCAAVHRDRPVMKASSSGGLFTALTTAFMEQGGVAYGCVLERVSEARHRRAASGQERDAMRGSKYIQSDMSESYAQILDDLQGGTPVYFSGTPCQCAALRLFLKVKKAPVEGLFVQEVLCHGVASPAFFRAYLSAMEKKFSSRAVRCSFRAKAVPGKKQDMEIVFENGKKYNAFSTATEPFYQFYHANYLLRESCYRCQYARAERVSDISLADFWGYRDGRADGDLDYSLCIVSSAKGAALLERCAGDVNTWPSDRERALESQSMMRRPSPRPAGRDSFREDFLRGGFGYIGKKYGNDNLRGKLKRAALWAANKTGLWRVLKKRLLK